MDGLTVSTTRYLKSGNIPETSIQKAVLQWVRLNPRLEKFIIHIPNEGKRTLRYGKSLKDMGMRAGVSDLFIAMSRHGYSGAWVELKSKQGILSDAQQQFKKDMEEQHYLTETCYSIEETIDFIVWYCFEESQKTIHFDPLIEFN